MKNLDPFIDRIFTLARRAAAPETTDVPFGLETAVVAHWRGRAVRSAQGNLLGGLRWAALLACAIALLAGALENDQLSAFRNRFDPEARVADSAIVAGYDYE